MEEIEKFKNLDRDTRQMLIAIYSLSRADKIPATINNLANITKTSKEEIEGLLQKLKDNGMIQACPSEDKYELTFEADISALAQLHNHVDIDDKRIVITLGQHLIFTPQALIEAGFYASYLKNLIPTMGDAYVQEGLDLMAEKLKERKDNIGLFITDSAIEVIHSVVSNALKEKEKEKQLKKEAEQK